MVATILIIKRFEVYDLEKSYVSETKTLQFFLFSTFTVLSYFKITCAPLELDIYRNKYEMC